MSAVDSTVRDVKKAPLQDTTCHTKEPSSNTHDGKVVSVTGDKLVMSSKDGKEHSHILAKDAKLSLDGKACKSSDLTPGMKIRVTSEIDNPHAAIRIKAIDKSPEFASL